MDCRARKWRRALRMGAWISCALALQARDAWSQSDIRTPEVAVHWPRKDFVIPFQIDPAGEIPSEIRLEVSENSGKTWNLYTRADVRTRQFHYKALRDGEYHFRLKTVDRRGNVFDNPGQPLVVMVDTVKPAGEMAVDIDPQGAMQAEIRMVDTALDPSTLKLEYQTDASSRWIEISHEIRRGTQDGEWFGFGTWEMPNESDQLVIRATVRDRAGNATEWIRVPRLPRSARAAAEMQLASNRDPSAPSQAIGSGVPEAASPQRDPNEWLAIPAASDPLPNPSDLQRLPSPPHRTSLLDPASLDTAVGPMTAAGPMSAEPLPRIEVLGGNHGRSSRPASNPDALVQDRAADARRVADETQNRIWMQRRVVSDSPATTPSASEIASPPTPFVAKPRGSQEIKVDSALPATATHPQALHSNSRQFSLDYAIDNDPGANVISVELWGTTDQGQSWEKWGTDADRQSPFDIQVEQDGLFGFTMVIVGANGVASKRPLPGDQPDSWIQVDTVQPQARLISALHGKGAEAGSIIIEYRAVDPFFGERPIALYWASDPKGPWQTVAQGARNSGRYVWAPDYGVPPSVYLKLEAIDAAGNITSHELDLPVDVHGAAPRGRIQGFQPQR